MVTDAPSISPHVCRYLAASLRARAIAALTPFFARRARTPAFCLGLRCHR
jgi:hypothetical protein